MAKDNAHLWRSRPWNQPAGRLIDWLRRCERSGSYTSRRGVYMAWVIAVQELGELATRHAVKAAGLQLPDWLVPVMPAPRPAVGSATKLLPARVPEHVERAA